MSAQYGRCPHCDAPLPNPWTDECRHRRACEARQMLTAGVSSADAARHAQRLPASDVQLESARRDPRGLGDGCGR